MLSKLFFCLSGGYVTPRNPYPKASALHLVYDISESEQKATYHFFL